MRNYKYFRVHTGENAYSTQLPRGIFVAVWRLVDNKVMTSEEINIYWENREWFEENLPIPPFYTNNNPDKAITWFKTTDEGFAHINIDSYQGAPKEDSIGVALIIDLCYKMIMK